MSVQVSRMLKKVLFDNVSLKNCRSTSTVLNFCFNLTVQSVLTNTICYVAAEGARIVIRATDAMLIEIMTK